MPSDSTPRYVVRTEADTRSRRRRLLWLTLAWLASLCVVGVAVFVATDRGPLVPDERSQQRQLKQDNDKLQQQVATLTRELQVSEVSRQSLQASLSDNADTIDSLRADLAFYSHLVEGSSEHQGLRVETVALTPVADSRAWNLTVTLTHNVDHDDSVQGTLHVAVDGLRDGQLTRLDRDDLGGDPEGDMDFDFRYFQQLHATLILPNNFTPNRVHVEANPNDGATVDRNVAWGDAKTPAEEDDVQQQSEQDD